MCDCPAKGNSRLSHSLLRYMSKRTSKNSPNVLEVANPNDLADGCDDTELSEGSKEPDSKESAAVVGGDNFMHTDDFRRLFIGFVMADTLVAMR